VALGLGAAAVWGASDFTGGFVARRAAPANVVVIAHGLGLLLLLMVLAFTHPGLPNGHTIFYGLCSGVVGGFGLLIFYEALSLGSMGLTAALAGVLTAALPVIVSFFRDGHPTPLQLTGFLVAAIAIWLVAYTPGGVVKPRGLGLATIAGLCFGLLLVLLRVACAQSVLLGLAVGRIASTGAAVSVSLWTCFRLGRREALAVKGAWRSVLLLGGFAGVLDLLGNLLYTLAALKGRLDIAAVLASLYPAETMLLAVWIMKERTSRLQTAGMVLAVAAVVLISI
jgi:drug/metabolite transporter (DMT)-like permease